MSVGSLFANAATEMLAPILPIFPTQSFGATGSVLGVVDGVAQALRNFVDGFSGAVSDHFRQRKAFVISGYALSARGPDAAVLKKELSQDGTNRHAAQFY
jgi:hypothetical protein